MVKWPIWRRPSLPTCVVRGVCLVRRWRDMQAVDEAHYKNLMWIMENDVTGLMMNFAIDVDRFGQVCTLRVSVTICDMREHDICV